MWKPGLFLLILYSPILYAQDFQELLRTADEAYNNGQYLKAAEYADSAFQLNPDYTDYDDLYNAACVHSLVGNTERALFYLEKSFINGNQDIEWTEEDSDLDNIRNTEEYRKILLTYIKQVNLLMYSADTAYNNGSYSNAISLYDSAYKTEEEIPNPVLLKMATLNAEYELFENSLIYLESLFQNGYDDISFPILSSKFRHLREETEFHDLISRYSDPEVVYTHTFINDLVNQSTKDGIRYVGKTIKINLSPYLKDGEFLGEYGLSFDQSNYLKLNRTIEVRDCIIEAFSMSKSYTPSIEMTNNSTTSNMVYITSLKTDNLILTGNSFPALYLSNLVVSEKFGLQDHLGSINIDDNTFNITDNLYIQGDIPTLTLTRCRFYSNMVDIWEEQTGEEYGNIIMDIESDKLEIIDNKFSCDFILNPSTVRSNLVIQENIFYEHFDLHTAILPELNKYLPYRQFEKGFAIFTDIAEHEYFTGIRCKYCNKYTGDKQDDFGSLEDFNKLIQSLQIIYSHYEQIGDKESGDATLFDINSFYENQARYLYKRDGGIRNFVLWKRLQFVLWQSQNKPTIIISAFGFILFTGSFSFYFIKKRKGKTKQADKRLAAIVFSDIVDYTSLMGSDEKKAMNILDLNRSIHITMVNRHHGNLLKEMGDGMLCSFQTASAAVNFCKDVQKENINADYNLRLGVHLGEVIFTKGDVYGDGVNIASRLQGEAKEGGICISGTVYQNVRNQTDIKVEYLGEKELKHVTTKVEMYEVKY